MAPFQRNVIACTGVMLFEIYINVGFVLRYVKCVVECTVGEFIFMLKLLKYKCMQVYVRYNWFNILIFENFLITDLYFLCYR